LELRIMYKFPVSLPFWEAGKAIAFKECYNLSCKVIL
jgi:hypothetical protein